MRVRFCGVRGSTPAPGADFLRYGGHTSCVALARAGEPIRLLLDAGTGLQAVTPLLDGPFVGSIVLGHLHWDHTHGLPFFGAGFRPGHRVSVRLPRQGAETGEAHLQRALSPPNFPIVPAQLGPGWSFTDLDEGPHDVEGFTVTAREIPHKGGRTFGLRVEADGGSLAYLSDHSPIALGPGPSGQGELHPAALALAAGVDLLIHDAQHRAAEFPGVGFLGHASPEYAVALGRAAGARTVALYHHAPSRTDDEVDAILAEVGPSDGFVLAAHEGLELDLPGRSSDAG